MAKKNSLPRYWYGNRRPLKALNDTKLIKRVIHSHLEPIWYHSKPTEVPYSPNILLTGTFSWYFLQLTSSSNYVPTSLLNTTYLLQSFKILVEPIWITKAIKLATPDIVSAWNVGQLQFAWTLPLGKFSFFLSWFKTCSCWFLHPNDELFQWRLI